MVAKGAITALSNDVIRDKLMQLGKQGLCRMSLMLDKGKNGGFDEADVRILEDYLAAHVSIWAQAAHADGVVSQEEEDEAFDLFLKMAFDGEAPLFPPELLKALGLKQRNITSRFEELFLKPMPMNKIVAFANQHDLEEVFYQQACLIVNSDNEVNVEEKEFLELLGAALGFSKFDQKRINEEIFRKNDHKVDKKSRIRTHHSKHPNPQGRNSRDNV
jgi:tellurite resistance protein